MTTLWTWTVTRNGLLESRGWAGTERECRNQLARHICDLCDPLPAKARRSGYKRISSIRSDYTQRRWEWLGRVITISPYEEDHHQYKYVKQ